MDVISQLEQMYHTTAHVQAGELVHVQVSYSHLPTNYVKGIGHVPPPLFQAEDEALLGLG